MKNEITVVILQKKFKKFEKDVKKIAALALDRSKQKNLYLTIYLIDSRRMLYLNKNLRRQNKTANVLSFKEPKKFPHPETKLKFLGEIYLNADYIKTKKIDIQSLIIHSLFHLLGCEHGLKSDKIKMAKAHRRLCSLLL